MRLLIAAGLILLAGAALAEDAPPSQQQQQQGPCTYGQSATKIQIMGVDPEVSACEKALLGLDLQQALVQKNAAGALKLKADAETKAANARADDLQKQLDWFTKDDAGLRALLPKEPK